MIDHLDDNIYIYAIFVNDTGQLVITLIMMQLNFNFFIHIISSSQHDSGYNDVNSHVFLD